MTGRPFKRRRIRFRHQAQFFKPAGVPMRNLDLVRLRFDELEALRLKNLQGLDNTKAAKRMNISRSTFQRILKLAYKKMSLALIKGQAIRVDNTN